MDEILINTIRGFSPFLKKYKPDLVIIHGDRTEPLACALSSLLNNFLVAHIEGGEVSGTVDEMLRHAISKISHIHLVSNKTAKKRLIQMGENKHNIHIVGSPDVDVILSKGLPSLQKVKKRYNFNYKKYSLGILHPVTTNIKNLKKESQLFFSTLTKTKLNYVLVYPNNDSGSDIIEAEGKKQIDKFAKVLTSVSIKIPNNINWILRVDGHTDKTPLKSNLEFDDNWELSQARALSVVRYLIKKHNIDPKRLVAAGFGEFQPIDNSNTIRGMALNRRIELKLTEK